MAAEVVEAFPRDEVLSRAGREQEVFLGELAEDPAALGPGPGCDCVRVASSEGLQQQRSVSVDRDPDGAVWCSEEWTVKSRSPIIRRAGSRAVAGISSDLWERQQREVLDEIKARGYGGDDGGELSPAGPWPDESR